MDANSLNAENNNNHGLCPCRERSKHDPTQTCRCILAGRKTCRCSPNCTCPNVKSVVANLTYNMNTSTHENESQFNEYFDESVIESLTYLSLPLEDAKAKLKDNRLYEVTRKEIWEKKSKKRVPQGHITAGYSDETSGAKMKGSNDNVDSDSYENVLFSSLLMALILSVLFHHR